MNFTQEVAAREAIRRRRSRSSLEYFATRIDIPGVPIRPNDIWGEDEQFKPIETELALHHSLMVRAIQKCMQTYNGRLMMFFPPGAAKSTYASVLGPAWRMGCPELDDKTRMPCIDIGLFSYASEIATKQSRRVRSMARDPMFDTAFRAHLSNEKGAADNWAMTNGSSMIAGGIRAGVTGNRFGGLVIDDPTKNREEADSEDIQQKNYDEYNDTLLTRLIPGGWVIMIQTLWSQLDIPLRILPEKWAGESGEILCQDGQVWTVLCVPAKCERDDPPDPLGRKPGEYLWPKWFKPGHWDKWEKNPTARRTWSALCQQNPTPKEGLSFTRSMFKRFSLDKPPGDDGDDRHIPATLNRYGASDYATLDSSKADYTEHGCVGMDWKGDLWFTDWWYGQKSTDKGIDAFIQMIKRNKAMRWANEGGTIDHAIRPAINRAMRESQKFVLIENFPSIEDKGAKLLTFHARAAAGTVHIPICEWGDRLVDLLCAWPAVKHDDAHDVCGLIGRMIDKMGPAALPKAPQNDFVQPWTEQWFAAQNAAPKGPRYTS